VNTSTESLPSAAVVMPTLDERARIEAQLERLLRAEAPEDRAHEVRIGDGGSVDGTCAAALALGAVVVPSERGRGRQLAAGARGATSDVLIFLHADNRLPLGALAAIRRAFADPQLQAAALAQRIDAPGWFFRAVERAADARARRGMVYGDSTLVVRRALYEELGGFAPLELFEDVEFSRRLRRVAHVRVLDAACVVVDARRWRSEGRTRATLRNWSLRVAYELGAPPSALARWYKVHAPERWSSSPSELR
jgi:rSAM/selenodomain-associated transferase 2